MFNKNPSKPQTRIDSLIGVGTRIEGNVNFRGGLRIDGDDAVIGAGSVVRGTVPPGEIWAGTPARRIRVIGNEPNQEISCVPHD